MQNILKKNWLSFVVSLAILVFGISSLSQLPQTMATHYNWRGVPDGYQGQLFGVLFLPLLTIGLIIFLPVLIRLSPQEYQMQSSSRSISKIVLAITLLLNGIQLGILMNNLQPNHFTMIPFFNISLAVFMIVVGNFFSKIERNFFIGVRTPWSIASDKNWLATHRFAARIFVSLGVVLILLSSFTTTFALALLLLLGAILISVTYSFKFYRSEAAIKSKITDKQ